MANILRKPPDSVSKIKYFVGQNSILRQYYIQNAKDGIQIRVYQENKEGVAHFSQFVSVKAKKISGSI